jgi:hypothetical protein
MKRIVLLAALATACGGGSKTAVDRNSAGSGSSTLLVTGTVTVTVSDTAPSTIYSVNVKDGLNANVTGATVTVGGVSLTDAGSGNYAATNTSYPAGDLSLSVVKGTDQVQGVVVGYPGAHAISSPAGGSTATANQVLTVTWTTPAVSKAARITLASGGFSAQAPDDGSYDIPAASNTARASQRVTISRSNEVEIAGGLPGSSLKVTVSNQTDPFTVQ